MKKRKRRLISLAFILIIIVALVIVLKPVAIKTALRIHGYSKESAEYFYKNDLVKKAYDNKYNETSDKMIQNDIYVDKYFDNYYDIEYLDDNEFFKEFVNKLLDTGYNTNLVNKIFTNTTKTNIEYLSNNKVEDIDKYMDVKIYKPDRIERYLNNVKEDYDKTVLYVNMDRDKKAYEDPNIIEKYSTTVLVNQHNMLNKDFKPELVELDKCSSDEHYLSKEAKEAYDKMCDAATSEGYLIEANSSYRDYDTQVATVNYYLKFYGEDYTNKYVAKPGYSEHQTGLAIDVKSKNGSPFKTTKEYKWMVDNSYKYGFILRYPEGREEELGYSAESWHFRYVGEEIAKYIYENNLIYDEYYALFLDK